MTETHRQMKPRNKTGKDRTDRGRGTERLSNTPKTERQRPTAEKEVNKDTRHMTLTCGGTPPAPPEDKTREDRR